MNTTMSAATNTVHEEAIGRPGERGYALLGTLLLLMMMSALGAALGVNGQTETRISRNQRAATQATVAAEAGLNHAVELATTYIFQWKANGFADVDAAIDALLLGPDLASGTVATDADNGSLGTRVGITFLEELPVGTRMTITGGINAEYEAFIMDDDATAPDEPAGDLFDDENLTLVVRAEGYAQDSTKVVLEALIAPVELGAVVTNGPLDLGGNVTIDGSAGSVHANGDMDIDGNSVAVSGTITASGTYAGSNTGSGGAPELSVPEVHASDYLAFADFILTSAGTMTDLGGTLLCTASGGMGGDCNEWDFDSGTGVWSLGKSEPPDGTYYVEGAVEVTGSPGGGKGGPVVLSIIAEGSIDISGHPEMTADTADLLFVTDGDLEISGDLVASSGQMLVHEQVNLTGTTDITGQLLVENATSVDTLVTANHITGTGTITYNGGLGVGIFSVQGWRDVRDAD
jgi:type II secretory pathway pseudopilin PulG